MQEYDMAASPPIKMETTSASAANEAKMFQMKSQYKFIATKLSMILKSNYPA